VFLKTIVSLSYGTVAVEDELEDVEVVEGLELDVDELPVSEEE
jgi:hypothetical protein